jgi:hypothetical protein
MPRNIPSDINDLREREKQTIMGRKNRTRLSLLFNLLASKIGREGAPPRLAACFLFRDPRRLVFDLDLRELSPDRCHDCRVFRLSTGASKRIAGVGCVFDRVAPGFRKHKIAFG